MRRFAVGVTPVRLKEWTGQISARRFGLVPDPARAAASDAPPLPFLISVKKLGHHFLGQEIVRLFGVRKYNEIGHTGLFDP